MTDMPQVIAEGIASVMTSVTHVQKQGYNEFHRYKFAAVGDLLAKIQPALVEAGLNIVQDELSHEITGDFAAATYQFTISHKSGVTWAEKPKHTGMAAAWNSKGGIDDKALNKCHTAARKYFLLSLFQIPTSELPDADAEEDRPKAEAAQRKPQSATPKTDKVNLEAMAIYVDRSLKEIAAITSEVDLDAWETRNEKHLAKMAATAPQQREKIGAALAATYQRITSQKEAAE